MRSLIVTTILMLNILAPSSAFAWGAPGHQNIARIAWKRLRPDVQNKVIHLLNSGDDAPTTQCAYKTMEQAATWLDCVRRAGLTTYFADYYHADRFTFCPAIVIPTKCATGHCASDALNFSIQKLIDPESKQSTQRVALKVMIHLVGDLHQPLHVERDANNFTVRYGTPAKSLNFHDYWDNDVISKIDNNQAAIDEVIAKRASQFEVGTVNDWVADTFKETKVAIYTGPLKNLLCNTDPKKNEVDLDADYDIKARHYAYFKISQAGVRLAFLLNSLFKAN